MRYLVDGGVLATFIDWRGLGSVSAAAETHGLLQINLIVWSKTNAGMGSPVSFTARAAAPCSRKGRPRPHVQTTSTSGARPAASRTNVWDPIPVHPRSAPTPDRACREPPPPSSRWRCWADALLDLTHRGEVVLDSFPWLRLDP